MQINFAIYKFILNIFIMTNAVQIALVHMLRIYEQDLSDAYLGTVSSVSGRTRLYNRSLEIVEILTFSEVLFYKFNLSMERFYIHNLFQFIVYKCT